MDPTKIIYSVIIPTLNEELTIGACIEHLRTLHQDLEIIVADGGSTDSTVQIAAAKQVVVCSTGYGRGRQCNAGAAQARGDVLIFLHSDTHLPVNAFDIFNDYFQHDRVNIGIFQLAFDVKHWLLDMHCLPSRWGMGLASFGDRGIIIRKSFFNSLGCFYNWCLFEDLSLFQRAAKKTRIQNLPGCVTTSARRFIQNGILKQQLYNFWYIFLYLCGISPEKLAHYYYRRKRIARDTALMIFLRFPNAGKVKTRLAQSIGDEQAAKFYRLSTEHILRECRKLSNNISRYIFCADKDEMENVRRWTGSRFLYMPQEGEDLGRRIEHAFYSVFSHGAQKAVIMATDVPDLSADIIREAISALDEHDVIIGPSHDGGYYLLGLKELHSELFNAISWSTSLVYQQTVNSAARLGLKVYQLPLLRDIDTAEDLQRWLTEDNAKSNQVRKYVLRLGL